MEKETLLNGFNQRIGAPDANGMYGETGISGRTLDVYLDQILPSITDDASVDDEFYNKHITFLKAMGGQMRHEKAEFIKNYKSQTPPATSPTPPTPPVQPESEFKQWLSKFEKEQEESKKQLLVKELRMDAAGKADELNVSNRALWKDAVGMVEYKDNMTLDEMTTAAKSVYEKKLKEYMGEGVSPYGGNGGFGSASAVSGETAKARREEFKRRMQAQGKLPKDEN